MRQPSDASSIRSSRRCEGRSLLSHLFLPAGIIAVVTLTVIYAVARNRSVLPVAAGAVSTATAWVLSHVAKALFDRPRPYEVVVGAVLRQQPAHGTSFPSTHTAVTVAVVIALVPFLPRALAALAITYAVLVGWSRGSLLGWRRHEAHIDNLKPEAADPLHEPRQGPLIWQLGMKGCRARADGDLAVIEFCAQRGARLTQESDLIGL